MAFNACSKTLGFRCKLAGVCYFSTSKGLLTYKRLSQRGNVLHKMLNSQKTKERRPKTGNFETSPVKSTCTLLNSVPGAQGRESRRQTVLNALFMEYITDLMSSGEVSRELTGKSIQILGVKVSQDFTILNVKWAGGDSSQDETIQQILNRSAGPLRSELIGLNILGKVPPIQFIRDRTYSTRASIDQALATADYGPDYVPMYRYQLEPIHVMTAHSTKDCKESSLQQCQDDTKEFSVLTDNNRQEQDTLANASEAQTEEIHAGESVHKPAHDSTTGSSLSKMRMDILGLKHDVLMNKVQDSIKRSKALHRADGNFKEEFVSTADTSSQKSYPSLDSQRFAKFLEDRKKKRLAAAKSKNRDLEAVNYIFDSADVDEGAEDDTYTATGDDDYFDDEKLFNDKGNDDQLNDDDTRDR